MRVCIATYPTAFQQPGGGERVLLSLAEALRGHVEAVEMFDPWSTQLRDFDVLHYFSSYGTDLFPEWRRHVPILAVTPFIWPELPRSVAFARGAWSALRRAMRRPVAGPFDAVDVLFPTSKREGELLIRNYGARPDQVVAIPHGVDLRFGGRPSGAASRAFDSSHFVFCPARIDPNKNQLRLVRALADADIDLVIAGAVAPGDETYAAACRAAAGPRTKFFPPLPHDSEELRDAMVSAACVVIPSEFELCSVAALEAAVASAPLASTAGGGMVEHLAPFAEFFDPYVEDDIRRAVLKAVARGRREGQREHFQAKFSWSEIARRTAAAYVAAP